MTHFGLVCPSSTGHLNTLLPLGMELKQRGHQVTLFGKSDSQQVTQASDLGFHAIGEAEFPIGSMPRSLNQLANLEGRAALAYTVDLFKKNAAVFLRDAPAAMRDAKVDALLVDQATVEGGTVADHLQIPFVSICSALILNRSIETPSVFTHWPYSNSFAGRLRNRIGYRLSSLAIRPVLSLLDRQRQAWNLPLPADPNDRFSPIAQISQQPAAFEFPRTNLPPWFHFAGPFHSKVGRKLSDFPFDRLNGKPLIYASLGTILSNALDLFEKIAQACLGLEAQLVISLGGSVGAQELPSFSGSPLVVHYAPQLDLLQRAAMTITHAGMNTTLECLNCGVPMVAIPMVNDQPGIASRIAWTGCGESIPVKRVSVTRLRNAIESVLTQDRYATNAKRLQKAIQASGGLPMATEIAERAATTGHPVLPDAIGNDRLGRNPMDTISRA